MRSEAQQHRPASSAAELVILPPPGPLCEAVRAFVGRCLIHGVGFFCEPCDRLPRALPSESVGVKAVVIDQSHMPAHREAIERYRAIGVPVYVMTDGSEPVEPNAALRWSHEPTFHAIVFDAGLTVDNPAFRRAMGDRDEADLYQDLHAVLLAHADVRWYDATRYQWACLLDAYELTGESRDLDAVDQQVAHAIDHVSNDLSNCDCVAPLLPVLRLYEHTQNARLLDYARAQFDRYLQITPTWRGALVNFRVYARHVRSEILWQVLPGLMRLGRITGDPGYTDTALNQFERLHDLLFDSQQGLWRHGMAADRASAAFWARGAAYTLLANVLLLEAAPSADPRTERMHATLQASAERLRQLQDASGFWHSVLGQPLSECESSGTAWLVAAFERGVRSGLLDADYRRCAEAAWAATKSRIWQGRFPGHMTATTVSPIASYYHKIHLSDHGWSHFAFRALCERMRSRHAQQQVAKGGGHVC